MDWLRLLGLAGRRGAPRADRSREAEDRAGAEGSGRQQRPRLGYAAGQLQNVSDEAERLWDRIIVDRRSANVDRRSSKWVSRRSTMDVLRLTIDGHFFSPTFLSAFPNSSSVTSDTVVHEPIFVQST